MQSTSRVPRFLKPPVESSWEEDKSDLDTNQSTTFLYNPNVSLSLDQQRQRLPIFQNKNHIIYLLEKYQTLILVGETGSGKSTQIPQYLLEAGWAHDGKIIGVTEPRRVAATTLASRVAEEKGSALGELVGYSIRFDDCFDPDTTKIKYMTEGILLREMMADPLLRNYSVIILDEVHERTLNTDIVLGLLKKILKKNKKLKLVISSATVDANQLKIFFNYNRTRNEDDDTATIMSVEGRLYPVDIHYVKEPVADYVKGVVETVMKIHTSEPRGDVLAFLTGMDEVEGVVSLLSQQARSSGTDGLKLLVTPLHGSLPNSEQLKAFRFTPRGLRKVVVATNIAETSVTIPGIVYEVVQLFHQLRFVGDRPRVTIIGQPACGKSGQGAVWESIQVHALTGIPGVLALPLILEDFLIAVRICFPPNGPMMEWLVLCDDLKSSVDGTNDNCCWLFTEEAFESQLEVATPPEMQRSDLSGAVLQLKALGIDSVLRFSFPSPPPAGNLLAALELCYALGAIGDQGELLEPLGTTMAEFPLQPLFAKALAISGDMGCSEEILTIISMLQVQSVFGHVRGGAAVRARVARRKFEVSEGDLLTYLNVFEASRVRAHAKEWCRHNFLNGRAIARAAQVRRSMAKLLERFHIPLVSCKGNSDVVRRCLTAGLFPNAAYLHHSGVYKMVRGNQDLHIHPTSVLFTSEQPQWLIFCEILHTNQAYMKDITVIEPAWLVELAPHFYELTIDMDT